MDEQYFIAFETVEQPLAAWLKDRAHISHDNPFPRSGKFSLLKEIQLFSNDLGVVVTTILLYLLICFILYF